MIIEHTHKLDYSITENNAVGPTTSLTLRTLDNASPAAADTIYLAMNGTDGGVNLNPLTATADSTNPVLTIEHAIDCALAQPTRNTIHIFRNGYVGDLVFSSSDNHSNAGGEQLTNLWIQVELGETATLNIAGGNVGTGDTSFFGFGLKLNGLYINTTKTIRSAYNVSFPDGKIRWCYIKAVPPVVMTGLTGGFQYYNNIIDGDNINGIRVGLSLSSANANSFAENNIIINIAGDSTTTNDNCAALNSSIVSPYLATFNHNSISNCVNFILLDISSETLIKNCIGNSYAFFISNPTQTIGTLTIQNNLVSGLINYIYGPDNQLGINPLFFNESQNDFRLMDERRKAPNSNTYFSFTSKAVYNPDIGQEPADDNRDLGPYDVSYTLLSDTWDQLEIYRTELGEGTDIRYDISNYQTYKDARGNQRRSGDTDTNDKLIIKRQISLKLKPEAFVGTRRSFEFVKAFAALGAKRWYPNDYTGLFTSNTTLSNIGTNQWEAPIGVVPQLISGLYVGFVCVLTDGTDTYYLRIYDNTPSILYLEDHRGNQSTLSAGNYALTCLYLPVEWDQGELNQNFPLWTGEGNALFPLTDRPIWGGETEQFEGHIRSLVIYESEDDI